MLHCGQQTGSFTVALRRRVQIRLESLKISWRKRALKQVWERMKSRQEGQGILDSGSMVVVNVQRGVVVVVVVFPGLSP